MFGRIQAPGPFQTSGTTHPTTQHHIPEDLHLQQYCRENVTSHHITH
jgi:hypothetical protein